MAELAQPAQQPLTESVVAEKIEPPIKTDPAERGKHSGKTVDELKSQMARVKKQMAGYRERGEKVPDKLRGEFSELTFAIRAKQAHGGKWEKIKEGDMEESNEFIGARLAAIKAGRPSFTVGGKTYKVTGDTSDEKAMAEGVTEAADPQDAEMLQALKSIPAPSIDDFVKRNQPVLDKFQKDMMDLYRRYSQHPKMLDALNDIRNKMSTPGYNANSMDEHLHGLRYVLLQKLGQPVEPYQSPAAARWSALTSRKTDQPGLTEGKKDDDWYGLDNDHKSHRTASGGTVTSRGGVTRHSAAAGRYGGYNPDTDPDKDDTAGDEKPAGEKRGRGRPKKTDRQPERVTAKAYKHRHGRKSMEEGQGVAEGMDDDMADSGYEPGERGEYDREGDMAKEQLYTIEQAARELKSILSDEENLPEWVQSKITKAMDYVDTARDYMLSQHDDRMNERELTGPERREKERVFTKHMKPKMGEFEKRYGKEAGEGVAHAVATNIAKGVKMGKKKTKEEVEETTTSGSVATSTDGPKGKKGVFGKGIYDSVNREVEKLIAESISINASISMDEHGPSKNLTVTASGDDAEKLAALLQLAGMPQHEQSCDSCGQSPCGCESMDESYGDTTATENKPNWPTHKEGSDNPFQYSGGLDGSKRDQTTVPVTGVTPAASPLMYEDEDLARMMEMAGIDQQSLKPWERTMKETSHKDESMDEAEIQGGPKLSDFTAAQRKAMGRPLTLQDLEAERTASPTTPEGILRLQQELGIEQPDQKMKESLMKELANFKKN